MLSETSVKDPMRPPGASFIKQQQSAGKSRGWSVKEILIAPNRRIAVVNGRVVEVGSVVDGAKVSAIYGNAVKLNVNGQIVYIAPVARDIKRQTR